MRLIDVDNFKKNNPEYLQLDIDYVTEVTVEDVLDCEPTVKAILTEWIVKRINYYSDLILTYPNEKELLYRQTELISLLEDWEKENEID